MPERRSPTIVVLDGHTTNPGDLSWDALAARGDVTVHARTAPEQLRARCRGASVLCTNKVAIDRELIAALPELRAIQVLATGVNVVDLVAAREHGVTVMNIPAYSTDSVAQHTIGLLLACCSCISELDASVHAGEWSRQPDWSYTFRSPIELAGKTLGLIGLGAIGGKVAEIAAAMGMTVIGYTPSARPYAGVRMVGLDELVASSDAISLHCPLTADNHQLIDGARLARCKPGAVLVNTARGGLLDEAAVAQALHDGHLGAAGIDVLTTEPPPADHPLLHAPRCVVTPHSAWATREARARLLEQAAANLDAWLAGAPINTVD